MAKDSFSDSITKSQIWKSIFRHPYEDSSRNRMLQVLDNVFLHLHPTKVPKYATDVGFTWGMGGISFLLFLVLTVTGVMLMFYYRPTAEFAYNDMKYLQHDVPFGMFMRNMHRWSAHLMVITVWLHMFRVFMTGSYKPPREFNWGVGVILLTLTLLLSFTGYLLPWDQLAIWAVTVGTNMARATPLLGNEGPLGPELGMRPDNDVRFALLGGTVVGPAALIRFYVLHVIFLPITISIFIAVHFWRVRKDGGISGPRPDAKPRPTPVAAKPRRPRPAKKAVPAKTEKGTEKPVVAKATKPVAEKDESAKKPTPEKAEVKSVKPVEPKTDDAKE